MVYKYTFPFPALYIGWKRKPECLYTNRDSKNGVQAFVFHVFPIYRGKHETRTLVHLPSPSRMVYRRSCFMFSLYIGENTKHEPLYTYLRPPGWCTGVRVSCFPYIYRKTRNTNLCTPTGHSKNGRGSPSCL